MKPIYTVFISIGSNKGDKVSNIEKAIGCLDLEDHTRVESVSALYQTEPQDYIDQDWFVNAAVKITTRLQPEMLLAYLKSIEKQMDVTGKEFRYGPRVIDLDIVYFEDQVMESENLTIPHPKMHERCFVLTPVCDIGPTIIHPVLNKTTQTLLDEIKDKDGQGIIPIKPKED